jgi:hypothetical protein
MKKLLLVLILFCPLTLLADDSQQYQRYKITTIDYLVNSIGQTVMRYTILLDTKTGKSWYFVVGKGSFWIPINYGEYEKEEKQP